MGGERGTNIKIDEFGGSRGSVRSPSYKFVSRFASAMKKRGKRGQRVVVLPFFAPPFSPFSTLFSRYRREICMSGQRGERGEGGRVTRESKRFRNVAQQPIRPQWGWNTWNTWKRYDDRGEEGERTVHSYTVIDRSYPCFRFVNSNWLDRGIDEFGMR